MYCMIHHSDTCDCPKDIRDRIEAAIVTMQSAEFNINILRRDQKELIEAMKALIETCPCDPDKTDEFLEANHRAVELIAKYQTK